MRLPMLAVLAGSLIAANAAPSSAQSVPNFNIDPSCRAASGAAQSSSKTKAEVMSTCRETEQKAREQIVKQWSEVSAADKAQCVPLSTLGGTPSYTELLTCIELAREARRLRKEQPVTPVIPDLPQATTTGQGAK